MQADIVTRPGRLCHNARLLEGGTVLADRDDDLGKALLPGAGEAIDPTELARRDLKKSLPKRFYKSAASEAFSENGVTLHAIVLDGRRVRTPAQNALAVTSAALAQAMAQEWQAQGEHIEPGLMPVTRLVNSAIDGVAREMDSVLAEIVKYAGSDLLCYRAGDPDNLVAAQEAAWNPVLDWLRQECGARFMLAQGVMFVTQPPEAVAAFESALKASVGEGRGAVLRLAALNVMTTLTGSALLALAAARGFRDAPAAWRAAHVDEDHQMQVWGEDAEALARRERRWREMQAAALVLALSGS